MNRYLSFLLLFSFFGCKPKQNNEGVPKEPAAGVPVLEATVDSVGNARKDGTKTAPEVPIDVKQQLPAALEVNLDRTHGLWQFPTLADEHISNVPKGEQGPYFLEADFNGDRKTDFAVQIVERDSAFVYAFTSTKNENEWQEHLLEKHPLTQQQGKKRSLQYLQLAKPTGTSQTSASANGITVMGKNSTATYVFADGQFNRSRAGE